MLASDEAFFEKMDDDFERLIAREARKMIKRFSQKGHAQYQQLTRKPPAHVQKALAPSTQP